MLTCEIISLDRNEFAATLSTAAFRSDLGEPNQVCEDISAAYIRELKTNDRGDC